MNVNDFFNAIDIYSLSEINSFDIINSGKVDNLKVSASLCLREKIRKRTIDKFFIEESIKKVYDVLDLLNDVTAFSVDQLDYDPYVDDSVVIYFKNRTIRLNLYVNLEMDDNEEDFEEAYLDFVQNNESYLVNDTLPNVIKLLNKLL